MCENNKGNSETMKMKVWDRTKGNLQKIINIGMDDGNGNHSIFSQRNIKPLFLSAKHNAFCSLPPKLSVAHTRINII